jgi:hypothetical protein
MPRGKVVDDIPVQVFRPASQIASWTLFGMLTLIGAIEASAYDTAKLTAHVVNSHIHFAFEWAMAMVFFGVLGMIGKLLERPLASGVAAAGGAFGYLAFTLAAVYDHVQFGVPELTIPVMTATLAVMYVVLSAMEFLVFSRNRHGPT